MTKQKDIDISKCRWMLYLKNGKIITENHGRGITWTRVYKQECNNMQMLCFQLIPSGKKVFVAESPYGEYWTFEEFEARAGQRIPTHMLRGICSLKDKELGLWDVVLVNNKNTHVRTVMTSKEIGYETRLYINKRDKVRV